MGRFQGKRELGPLVCIRSVGLELFLFLDLIGWWYRQILDMGSMTVAPSVIGVPLGGLVIVWPVSLVSVYLYLQSELMNTSSIPKLSHLYLEEKQISEGVGDRKYQNLTIRQFSRYS